MSGFFPVIIIMMVVVVVVMVCLPLSLVISADSFHSARTGVLFPIWIRMTKHGVVTSLFSTPRPKQPASQAINITKTTVSSRRTLQRWAIQKAAWRYETVHCYVLVRSCDNTATSIRCFTGCMSVIEVSVIPGTWFLARFTLLHCVNFKEYKHHIRCVHINGSCF